MSLRGRDEEIGVKPSWHDGNVICMEEMIEIRVKSSWQDGSMS